MPNNLRLTLRTLLSYLDDTLDPGQARAIGQKVAESEQARELMDRIKQVTRRRRLTTPPTAGPGGIDPNTIAEYLDNEVTAEQAAEVEQICLASDVHLAEVAACHQILTLVLGEPALVPPSAKQRMYALVKGPEAIPFRKPAGRGKNADLDLSTSDAGHDDETAPAGSASLRNTLILAGGGVIAVCLLIFAFWQVFGGMGERDKDAIAQRDKTEKTEGEKTEGEKKTDEEKKTGDGKTTGADKTGTPDKKTGEDKKTGAEDKKGSEDKTPLPAEDIPFAPPDLKTVAVLGQYEPQFKGPDVLLQKVAGNNWERFTEKTGKDVSSGRSLMALPAMRSKIGLRKGVNLELWGSSPEIWPSPFLYETLIEVYSHPAFDLDMTLRRGRVVLTNNKPLGKAVRVRIRFENPTQKDKSGYFDIAFQGASSAVAIERLTAFKPGEPFYEDPAHATREGPIAAMFCVFLDCTGELRSADTTHSIDATKDPVVVVWKSESGLEVPQGAVVPDWMSATPKLGKPADRTDLLSAAQNLAGNIKNKDLPLALPEAMESMSPTARKLAIRSYAATDDVNKLLELLDSESVKPDMRREALASLSNWMSKERDAEYKVFKLLQGQQTNVVARKIMELMHGLPQEDLAKPATWQRLIDDLNNPVITLRELSAWQLELLLPVSHKRIMASDQTRYSATAPEAQRLRTMDAWRKDVPPGSVPMKK